MCGYRHGSRAESSSCSRSSPGEYRTGSGASSECLRVVVSSDGDVVLYYAFGGLAPVVRRIVWFTEAEKAVDGVCFDPSATWLLVSSTLSDRNPLFLKFGFVMCLVLDISVEKKCLRAVVRLNVVSKQISCFFRPKIVRF